MANDPAPQFACDVMLGSLARWLRAAGYDAWWSAKVEDWDLVRLAQREGRTLLSSDTGIFRIGIIRDGEVAALLVPHGLSTQEQLTFVLRELRLDVREPRCMSCGGRLAEIPKEQARDRAPPRSFAWVDRFHTCDRCGKLFWEGTHWRRIADCLAASLGRARTPRSPEAGG